MLARPGAKAAGIFHGVEEALAIMAREPLSAREMAGPLNAAAPRVRMLEQNKYLVVPISSSGVYATDRLLRALIIITSTSLIDWRRLKHACGRWCC